MKTFTLPDLGEGLQDAEIVSWHVSLGQRVVSDQPLVAVETEKAVVEIPAPWSGTVTRLHAEPGDIIEIGEPLVDFDTGEASEDAGAVVGELPQAASGEQATSGETEAPASPPAPRAKASAVKAAPAVRKLASDLGVDLTAIAGTGPAGAINRRDVEAAAAAAGGGWEPLRGVRRTMARNMAEAHAAVATTTVTDEANIERWPAGEDVTIRLVRAIVAACKAEPALNAWYDGNRQARLRHECIDLGIAVNTEDGLFVPVLRDTGNRTDAELRGGLEAMRRDIAARSIPPHELRGQTITLSNFGMIGGRHAALIVMPPQVAILGAGRIRPEPRIIPKEPENHSYTHQLTQRINILGKTHRSKEDTYGIMPKPRIVNDGIEDSEIRACRILPLSLTFDHRAVTGAQATRFLMAAIRNLEG